MKTKSAFSRSFLRMVAQAIILSACLFSGMAIAITNPSSDRTQIQIDLIANLLENRQIEEAVGQSQAMVDSLESQGAQGANLAVGLEVLARSLRRNQQYREPETIEIAKRAVAACSGIPPANPNLKAACINTLGLVIYQNSEFQEALPLFEEATKLWIDDRGPDDQKVAAAYNNQGLVLQALGRDDEALVAYENAVRIYQLYQSDPQIVLKLARTTMSTAKLHLKLGNYEEAGLRGEKAIEIFQAVPGGNHPRLGSAMGDLAALYRAMGELDRSESLYETAIPILEESFGPDHSEVGRVLNNLGNLRADRGDIAEARLCFERALFITEKAQGPDDPQTGLRLLNLGAIMGDLGDLNLAAIYLMRSQEIFSTRLGPDHLYTGYAKQGLGAVLAAKGDFEPGLAMLLEAKEIFIAQFGSSHMTVAAVLADASDVYVELGRYHEAEQSLRQGLIIVRRELGSEHPEVVHLMHSQGQLALRMGDPEKAENILSEALAIGNVALGSNHPSLAAVHLDLAYALADLGRSASAFDHALTAERMGREHFSLAALAFEERRALQYAQKRVRGLGLATSLVLKKSETGDQLEGTQALWDELVRSRGLVLDLMGARQHHQYNTDSSQALVDSLKLATSDLAHLFVRGVGEGSPEEYRRALSAAHSRRESIERRLAATSYEFAHQIAASKAGFEDVSKDLARDAVLVSFLNYSSSPDAEANLAAFVLRPEQSSPEIIFLGAAGEIENAVTAWRRTILDGLAADGDKLQAVADENLRSGRILAALIWDPLSLDDASGHVYIVPDGAVAFVDFMSLPRLRGGFLVENDAVLALVSSERDLLHSSPAISQGTGLLVMGGMSFGSMNTSSPVDCGNYKNLRFEPLPATRYEAETVASMWSEFTKSPVYQMLGQEADEGNFKAMASRCEVVHLATHGFFLGTECRDPAASTRGTGLSPVIVRPQSLDEMVNPLLRAGLAFSRANDKSGGNQLDDGILTAYEVAALDMSGVGVAVLSACNTGQGDFLDGEGVFGLQRAFAMAGTRSLIMSLYPVDDDVAAIWMANMYRNHLLESMDYPLAVREASRKMLMDQRSRGWPEHPFTWSPFVRIRTGS